MKQVNKILISLLASIVGFFLCATSVFAVETIGVTVSRSYDGYSYQAHTTTAVYFGVATGTTAVEASSSRPAGYMGAASSLYNGSGVLVDVNVQYSQSSTNSILVLATGSVGSANRFFTSGTAYIYRTNGTYSSFNVPASPYATLSMEGLPPSGVTDDGLTYGSGLISLIQTDEKHVDLVSAIGQSGFEGYVMYTDLVSATIASSPLEALTEFASEHDVLIPLYNLDGEVIDSFAVHCGGVPQNS